MKRILITGMSGTGKSSVVEFLRAHGFDAIDTDFDGWCESSIYNGEPDWIWREDWMHDLLRKPLASPLFVSGCAPNQGKFYEFFDAKVLLSAPLEVILERVASRSSNSYGKTAQDRDAICWNYRHIQPLLQRGADFELDSATRSVDEMAEFLIALALR
jgi:shikimate kinase